MGFPEGGSSLHPNGDGKLVCSDKCPISIKLKHSRTSIGVSESPQVQLEEDILVPKQEQSGTRARQLLDPAALYPQPRREQICDCL